MTAYGALMTAGYRADNLRAWKQNASGKTYYYYAGGTPLFETDASGNVTAINVFSPDGLTARQQSGNWIYYTFDQQGNVAQRLDAGQNVLSNGSYDSYGAGAASPSGDPFGYNAQSGYFQDSETGLYYCQNRYYDTASGRWMTRDPIGFGGGMNIYGYASGGPNGRVDRSGLMSLLNPQNAALVGDGIDGAQAARGANAFLRLGRPFVQAGNAIKNFFRGAMAFFGIGAAAHESGADEAVEEEGSALVGRWMCQAEHTAMESSGSVQVSNSGAEMGRQITFVSMPPDPGNYIPQSSDEAFVTFRVPLQNVINGGKDGWSNIIGGGDLFGRGLPPGMPPFTGLGPFDPSKYR